MDENRLWVILDDIRNDVKDICVRIAVVETDLKNHLESQRNKFNKTTVVLGIVIAIVAVVAGLK